ncbi:MAG TPA: alpha/beta hydrolase, partial [Anaerolineae bacterium]
IAIATAPQSSMVVGIVSNCAFAELHCIVQRRVSARGFPSWLAALLGWLIVICASIRLRANLFSADPLRWVDQVAPRPLLILHAKNDADVPAEQARRLYAAARAPKELWIVPNAIHRAIEDVARDDYRQRVIDFFNRVFAMAGR